MAHKLVQVTNPAAGADWGATVPAGKYWIVRACTFLFSTSATVANRLVRLILYAADGTTPIFVSDQGTAQAASQANSRYSAGQGLGSQGTTNPRTITLPSIVLAPGCKIGTSTALIDAGDTYTAINLWVDEVDSDEYRRPGTVKLI